MGKGIKKQVQKQKSSVCSGSHDWRMGCGGGGGAQPCRPEHSGCTDGWGSEQEGLPEKVALDQRLGGSERWGLGEEPGSRQRDCQAQGPETGASHF